MASPQDSPIPGAMPMVMYGTAWKKEKTAKLVYEAVKAGFRGIDSGVGSHYNEPGVGEGLGRAFAEGIVRRSELWIQTKISSTDARFTDDDIKARWSHLDPKIGRAIASALQSLDDLFSSPTSIHVDSQEEEAYIDAILFHETHAYQADEILAIFNQLKAQSLLPRKIRCLGVCNTSLAQLASLENVGMLPSIIQNPFSMFGTGGAAEEFDASVRRWCRSKNNLPDAGGSSPSPEDLQFMAADNQKYQTIDNNNNNVDMNVKVAYQAFHTLTSNRQIWENAPYIERLSRQINAPKPVVWYSLLISAGIVVLNGTGTPAHMKGDLDELKLVWKWRESDENTKLWDLCRGVFLDAIDGDGETEEA